MDWSKATIDELLDHGCVYTDGMKIDGVFYSWDEVGRVRWLPKQTKNGMR
jgi:hypothetical protein